MGKSLFVPNIVEVDQGAPHLTFCQEWDLLAGIPTYALHTDESKPPEQSQQQDVAEKSLIWEMVHTNMQAKGKPKAESSDGVPSFPVLLDSVAAASTGGSNSNQIKEAEVSDPMKAYKAHKSVSKMVTFVGKTAETGMDDAYSDLLQTFLPVHVGLDYSGRRLIYSSSVLRELVVWDIDSGKPQMHLDVEGMEYKGLREPILCSFVGTQNPQRFCIACSAEGGLFVWDTQPARNSVEVIVNTHPVTTAFGLSQQDVRSALGTDHGVCGCFMCPDGLSVAVWLLQPKGNELAAIWSVDPLTGKLHFRKKLSYQHLQSSEVQTNLSIFDRLRQKRKRPGLVRGLISGAGDKYVSWGYAKGCAILWSIDHSYRYVINLDHAPKVRTCSFSSDGRRMVISCFTGQFFIYDVSTRTPKDPMSLHHSAKCDPSWSVGELGALYTQQHGSCELVTWDYNDTSGRLHIWDGNHGGLLSSIVTGGTVMRCFWSTVGNVLVTITQGQQDLDDYHIQLWDADQGTQLLNLPQQGPGSGIELDACKFSTGGARFVTYSSQALDHQNLYVWQPAMLTKNLTNPYQLTLLHENESRKETICACAFGNVTMDFVKLAHTDTGGILTLCDVLTGQTLWMSPLAEQGIAVNVEQLLFTEEDDLIVAAMIQGSQIVVRVFEVRTGDNVANYQGGGSIKLPMLLGNNVNFSKKHAVFHSIGISLSSSHGRVAIAGYRGIDVWNLPKKDVFQPGRQTESFAASRVNFSLENMHDRTPIVCCEFGKSGQRIVFGDTRGAVGLYVHGKGMKVGGSWQYHMLGTINPNVMDDDIDVALMCSISQDEETVAVCGLSGRVVIWKLDANFSKDGIKEHSRTQIKVGDESPTLSYKLETMHFNPLATELRIIAQKSDVDNSKVHTIKLFEESSIYIGATLPAHIQASATNFSADLLRGMAKNSQKLDIYDLKIEACETDWAVLDSQPKYSIQILEHMGSVTSCTMSNRGDMIACGTLFGQVVVATPQGLVGILPDYEQCLVRSNFSAVKPSILQGYLDIYGVALLNVPDVTGKNFIIHTVNDKNDALLRSIIAWAKEHKEQLCLMFPLHGDVTKNVDALSAAIEVRSAACISILLDAMLNGEVVSYNTTATILEMSFQNLVDLYPFMASELLMDTRLLRPLINMGMVPPALFIRMTKVKFTGADALNPFAVVDVWERRIQKAQTVEAEKLIKKDEALDWKDWFDMDWQELEHKMKTQLKTETISNKQLHSSRIGKIRAKSFYSSSIGTEGITNAILYQAEEFDQSIQIPAEPRVVLYKNVAAAGKKSILRSMLQAGPVMNQAFDSPTIRGVIDFKWRTFAQAAVLQQMALYFILLLLFICFSILATRENMGEYRGYRETSEGIFVFLMAVLALIISIIEVCYELYHIRKRYHKYGQLQLQGWERFFQLTWNIFDTGVHIIMMPLIVLFIVEFKSHYAMWGWGVLTLRLIVMEFVQIFLLGALNWLQSAWNWVDLISMAILVVIFGMKHLQKDGLEVFSYLMSIQNVLLWVRFMNFGTAFRGTGPTIQMIFEIIKDIRFFVLLMGLISFGFGNAFFILFQYNASNNEIYEPNADFQSVAVTMVTMVGTVLGALDMGEFVYSARAVMGTILCVLLLLLVAVVMLNLLIAIMGDSYDRIKENEESRFLKGRSEMIDEIEAVLPHAALGSSGQPFLHALIPDDLEEKDIGAEKGWKGRMATIVVSVRRMLQKELQNSTSMQKDELVKVDSRLDHMEAMLQKMMTSTSTSLENQQS